VIPTRACANAPCVNEYHTHSPKVAISARAAADFVQTPAALGRGLKGGRTSVNGKVGA
jgi:hypothetical protein